MEFTTQLIQVMGLLVILAGATMVFVHLITWIFGNRHSQVRIGLELVLFFSIAYALRNPALEFTGIHALADDFTRASLSSGSFQSRFSWMLCSSAMCGTEYSSTVARVMSPSYCAMALP